jgi:hypothetical protein
MTTDVKHISFSKAYTLIGKDVFAQIIEAFDDETMCSFVKAVPMLGLSGDETHEIQKIVMEVCLKEVVVIPHERCKKSLKSIPWRRSRFIKTLQLLRNVVEIPAASLLKFAPPIAELKDPLESKLKRGDPLESKLKRGDPLESKTEIKDYKSSIDSKTEVKWCVQCDMPFPHIAYHTSSLMNCTCNYSYGIVYENTRNDGTPPSMESCAAHESETFMCESLCLTCRYKRPLACWLCDQTGTKLQQIDPSAAERYHEFAQDWCPSKLFHACIDNCQENDSPCRECNAIPKYTRDIYYNTYGEYYCLSCKNSKLAENPDIEFYVVNTNIYYATTLESENGHYFRDTTYVKDKLAFWRS